MSKLLRAFVVSLQVFSLAASCAAQGGARPPKDEEPLAAALRLARGLEFNKEGALVRLVYTHLEAGRLEEAARAAGAMDDGGVKAVMLSRLANRFAEAGKFERAFELLSESLLVVRRADDGAEDLLREIVGGEVNFNTETFPPRNETRKGALARLFEAGRAEAAAAILSQVREATYDPYFNDLVAARALAGAARLHASSDASKAASLLSEALAAVRRVESARETVWGLCEVALAHADVGDKRGAEALLDEAQQTASALGDYRDSELRGVARAYAAVGLTEKALKAVPEPPADDWDSSVFAVEAAAAAGRPETLKESLTRAIAKAASLEGENSKSQALTDLVETYGTRAPDLLADVLRAARSVRDDCYRARALAAVGDKYAEAGRKAESLDAWGRAYESARAVKLDESDFEPRSSVRGDRDKLRLLTALAARLVRAGEYGRAPEIARDLRAVEVSALALTGGDEGAVEDADGYLAKLADELTRAGRKEAALAVLAEACDPDEKLGEDEEPYRRANLLAAVGAAYAKAGDKVRAALYLRHALRLAEEIKDYGGLKLSTLVHVGALYAEAGIRPDARARKSLRAIVRGVEADKD